ncbi:histone-lysine N-methyltransferase eggless [Lucilia cuprina]|uniref:histone-lysine N-methyltransferase eggless n=1 Tax=Lucilia cuprina TaxID=7375 RepID=UPI001F066D7B|nr:histone-lysine N-methyltransferase eggless [Lucilia cuprina]
MSEYENKNEVPQETSETTVSPLATAQTTNTEMPALESAFRALEEIANEDFDLMLPEMENLGETSTMLEEKIKDNVQISEMVGEQPTTSNLKTVEENLELSKAEAEQFMTEAFYEGVDSALEPAVEPALEPKAVQQIEEPKNIALDEVGPKEVSNLLTEQIDLNVTEQTISKSSDSNEQNMAISPVKEVPTVEPPVIPTQHLESSTEKKVEDLKNKEETVSAIKAQTSAIEEPVKQTDDVESSKLSQQTAEKSEVETQDDIKDTIAIEQVSHDVASIESELPIKENIENEIPNTEPIEPMDTCDSQESINLIIDETSNNAETKDELLDNNKIDEDTNMEVDLKKTTTEDQDKTAEESQKNVNTNTEITNEKVTKKEAQSGEDKTKNKDCLNKTKNDDDVIPIEQPPVPVIEIDDEDDMETENKHTAMDVDKNPKESKVTNEEPINSNNQNEDLLLEKSSEKPLNDNIINEEPTSSSNDIEETNDEVFYNKECINYECPHKHKQFFKVPQFAFSYYKVTKKKFKTQYICADCYDKALEMYEEFCGLISAKQPLLLENIPTGRQEFVEIIDSSDDEDTSIDKAKTTEPLKTAFSKNDLSLIESELHATIKSVLERVEIQNQLTWSKTILTERLKRLEMETEYVDGELKALQRKADKMHEGLYSCPKIKIRQLQPLDLNSGKLMSFETPTVQKEVQPIPPVGEIERPPIQQNFIYFAVKNNPIASWVPCRVMELVDSGSYNVKHYKIKFIKNQNQVPKTVPAKYLAYYDPPAVRLPIGTRVIAYFDATSLARGREKINVQSAFYPGIIAEPLKPNNKFRYLIFYDDGYTQYVYHKDVRLVCHVSDCVWEDVHPASRDFIQKYLTQYSINRPMVQTQKGQSMNTESNGYWLHARVVDIDCSLVLMQFEGSKSHTEWIYRGSLRLGPVFKEYQKSLQKNSNMPVSRLPRRTEPFIRYTEDEETSSQQQQQQQQQQQTEKQQTSDGNRAVARKTFGRPESMMNSAQPSSYQQQQLQQPTVKHLNNSTIYVEDENKPKGKVVYYTAKRNLPPRKFVPHQCSPSCLFEITHNLSAYSPLSKPLLSGWERFIIRQKIKRVVTYRAPCGKILRNMKELHHYLRATNNVLNVDNFDFSHEISCLAEYVIESAIVQKRDISGGQEKMAIPLVNYYDNTLPPECKYSAKVIPTEGVHINTDPAFLVGCDCEDDCIDKTKCACWQLTLAGAKYGNPNAAPEEVGYQYRRLHDHVPTGIYECNANCKCKSSCLNRVVQNSLTMKLQVFKTSNRGWGLRCINDIPRGSFVCVYAGHLLTEAKANEGGQDAGDEYFAELDYIEVAEQIKEGYESEVELPEPEEEDVYNPELDDDDFTPSKSFLTRAKQKQNAARSTRPGGNQDDESQERQVINFNPNADMNEDSVRENSIRKLYGKDEACYVMDAKISGNLGRYFNHSCAPNMFVQNVFVDTHDLRFPNVAFFSSCNIRAGTELTWNYNYEVGVVPGKVLYCQCGAANCRLRLL